jgi:hypothetical protein
MSSDNSSNEDIIASSEEAEVPELTMQDLLLNDSRITPTGNGNADTASNTTQPTSGQKWWAAVLLAFVAAIIYSPAAYAITSTVTTSLGGIPLAYGPGANLAGLVVHTLILIIIFRLILW